MNKRQRKKACKRWLSGATYVEEKPGDPVDVGVGAWLEASREGEVGKSGDWDVIRPIVEPLDPIKHAEIPPWEGEIQVTRMRTWRKLKVSRNRRRLE